MTNTVTCHFCRATVERDEYGMIGHDVCPGRASALHINVSKARPPVNQLRLIE